MSEICLALESTHWLIICFGLVLLVVDLCKVAILNMEALCYRGHSCNDYVK